MTTDEEDEEDEEARVWLGHMTKTRHETVARFRAFGRLLTEPSALRPVEIMRALRLGTRASAWLRNSPELAAPTAPLPVVGRRHIDGAQLRPPGAINRP